MSDKVIVTPDAFSNAMNAFITRLSSLKSLSSKVYTTKAGGSVKVYGSNPDGTPNENQVIDEINRNTVGKMFTAMSNQAKRLPSLYKKAYNYNPKGKRAVSINSGFLIPLKWSPNMINFFNSVNLGTVNINGQEVDIKSSLPLAITRSTSNRTLLRSLFDIYISQHKLVSQADDNRSRDPTDYNKSLFAVDQLMYDNFSDTLQKLTNESAKKLREANASDNTPKTQITAEELAKGKRQRHYYARRPVLDASGKKMRVPIVDSNGLAVLTSSGKPKTEIQQELIRTRPIYNDFYHQFKTSNISKAMISSIIADNVENVYPDYPPGTAPEKKESLYKLNPAESKAYGKRIEAAKTTYKNNVRLAGEQAEQRARVAESQNLPTDKPRTAAKKAKDSVVFAPNYRQWALDAAQELGYNSGTDRYSILEARGIADAESNFVKYAYSAVQK